MLFEAISKCGVLGQSMSPPCHAYLSSADVVRPRCALLRRLDVVLVPTIVPRECKDIMLCAQANGSLDSLYAEHVDGILRISMRKKGASKR